MTAVAIAVAITLASAAITLGVRVRAVRRARAWDRFVLERAVRDAQAKELRRIERAWGL